MKAAIYARYSSENQREESIDDQVFACRKYASARDLVIEDRHIFSDKAASGARKDRPGLNALLGAAEAEEFQIVLVDDLSRLARDNFLMLSVLAELRFNGVEVASVADGLETQDEENMLGIQIRGIFNELQLRDLRKKTLRGQLGQKQRGFTVGERTFGYKSVPVGEMRMDKKGRPRPDGYKMEIDPVEAAVVLRIFKEVADGTSLTRVVMHLNEEGVPGRFRTAKRWSPATLTRMLHNEKYCGRWVWNRTETRRDPKTGRRRRFPKPESEWIVQEDESLRIIPQELWDSVQAQLEKVRTNWPGEKGKRGYQVRQKGRVAIYPTQLFAGAMSCDSCGSSISTISGRHNGYYGCLAAKKSACDNRILVRRVLLERVMLAELRDRVACRENLEYVLKRVEKEIANAHSDLPETIKLKRVTLNALDRKVTNFLEFIGEGRGSKALAGALEAAERHAGELREELDGLESSRDAVFQPPPIAWVQERLATLQAVLARRTEKSALLLRRVLGPIRLEPVQPEVGRPYYRAHSHLDVLAVIDEKPNPDPSDPGSTVLRKWRRGESNPSPEVLMGTQRWSRQAVLVC